MISASDDLIFLVYATERYKNDKNLTGFEVKELFDRYDVWDYIYTSADALSCDGDKYIVEAIDLFIEARKPGMGVEKVISEI